MGGFQEEHKLFRGNGGGISLSLKTMKGDYKQLPVDEGGSLEPYRAYREGDKIRKILL